MRRSGSTKGQSGLDRFIIGLLAAGVLVSILLEIAGILLFCSSHGRLTVSAETTAFIHGTNLDSLAHYVTVMVRKQGIDIFLMTLGIIVLIATPFVRVIASMVYFAVEKDVKFFFITFFVFSVLLISLMIH